jgi:hypothetical protein
VGDVSRALKPSAPHFIEYKDSSLYPLGHPRKNDNIIPVEGFNDLHGASRNTAVN